MRVLTFLFTELVYTGHPIICWTSSTWQVSSLLNYARSQSSVPRRMKGRKLQECRTVLMLPELLATCELGSTSDHRQGLWCLSCDVCDMASYFHTSFTQNGSDCENKKLLQNSSSRVLPDAPACYSEEPLFSLQANRNQA